MSHFSNPSASRAHAYPTGANIYGAGISTVILDAISPGGTGEFDIAAYTFTPRRAGYYFLSFSIQFVAALAAGWISAYVQDDLGAIIIVDLKDAPALILTHFMHNGRIVYLTPPRVFTLRVNNATGGNVTITSGGQPGYTFFNAHRVS